MNPMFYFLLALTAVLAATADPGGPVLDTDEDIIFQGSYYVLPVIFGAAGGGLNLSPRGGSPCPLYVGQEESEVNRGIPVKFSNWRSRVGFVPESANLNIEMDVAATICVQSTYWWLTSDGDSRAWLVAAGPDPKSAEENPSKSFFQIKKTNSFLNGYNIMFCPNDNICIDVGIFVDESGVRRLGLSPTPFPVVFVKANGPESSSKIKSVI